MPQPPEEEQGLASGETPKEPRLRDSSNRKWVLYLVMLVLGLPVVFVMLAPPFAGGWILWNQIALYRQDEGWREFSLFDLATGTVEPELAANIRWPGLAVCNEFRGADTFGNAGRPPSGRDPTCPQLGPWQSWLLSPASFPEWHRRVAGAFRFVPVSSLLFLFGLMLSYLLRLFGADWRFRTAPPAPPPVSSSATPAELTSRPPGSPEADE